jgi:hypothetical protein
MSCHERFWARFEQSTLKLAEGTAERNTMDCIKVEITREELEAIGLDLTRQVKVRDGRLVYSALPTGITYDRTACDTEACDALTPPYAIDVWQFGSSAGRRFQIEPPAASLNQ